VSNLTKFIVFTLGAGIVVFLLHLPLLFGAVPNTVSIEMSEDEQTFLVTFEAGSVNACTVFEQQGTDYSPRHCYYMDLFMTSYEDDWAYICKPSKVNECVNYDTDWLVYANIFYFDGDLVVTRTTNKILVHR